MGKFFFHFFALLWRLWVGKFSLPIDKIQMMLTAKNVGKAIKSI